MFYKQYEKDQPFLQNDTPAPAIERLQSPEDRAKAGWPVRVYSVCMLFNQLPVFLVEPGQVHRPGWSAAGYRFLADSRDNATEERLAIWTTRSACSAATAS